MSEGHEPTMMRKPEVWVQSAGHSSHWHPLSSRSNKPHCPTCTEKTMPYASKQEPGGGVGGLSTAPQDTIRTHGMNRMCGSHNDHAASRSTSWYFYYSGPQRPISSHRSLHFLQLRLSSVSAVTTNLTMTLTRLKTSLRPGNHGNALRGRAGWRPIGSGLWLGGWDCAFLAITTPPQDHFRGLTP